MKKSLLILILFCNSIFAQNPVSITEKTKNFTKKEGFFNFYIDEQSARIYLEIKNLNQEFLYVNSLPAGLGSNDIGLDRGQLGNERIVFFEKVGKKLLLTQPNYKYRAISNDPNEKRAVKDSFAASILWGFPLEAEENGSYLVEITDFLLRDSHEIVNTLKNAKQGTYQLNASRSALYFPRTKNFPLNSEFEATLTFTGGLDAGNFVQTVAPSAEALTVRTHHSFMQLPDSEYVKRPFDPRSSFYGVSYYDFATPVSEPIEKYFIARHRLKKKNPSAAISEALKPIVYYLDNGTPEPIRSALLDGARWWNQAFEAAGYKDAFQVKVLPDDADPMDCRYNVINWVHRSTRGWSYGSSVIDPRTGEIIKGHVTLGSLRVRQDYLIATGLLSPYQNGEPADDKMMEMALQRLRQLAAHEVGHTLGIMHNYSASINNKASVMDYPHPQIKLNANNEIDLTDAYTNEIGDWDKVAITYGYQDFPPNTDEKAALNLILKNGIDRGLLFLTDQDARPEGSVSATAHLWDNGTDPVSELNSMLKIREVALNNFSLNSLKPNLPMAFLEDALVPIYNLPRYQVEAACKIIGSQNYTYALKNDGQVPVTIVPKTVQITALNSILESISPQKLAISDKILSLIPPRPAGYSRSRELFNKRIGLSFDPLSAAESAASLPIGLLLNVERANRLAINGSNANGFGLSEMLKIIYTKVFTDSRLSGRIAGFEELIQMQNEQLIIGHLLALSTNENASYQTKAISKLTISNWQKAFEKLKLTAKTENQIAHLSYLIDQIKNPDTIRKITPKAMAPGAPIGCEDY
jgi:Met-zincin/Domain of unknown function (DUF5117)/Domain of unknown function (DUF5118)